MLSVLSYSGLYNQVIQALKFGDGAQAMNAYEALVSSTWLDTQKEGAAHYTSLAKLAIAEQLYASKR